MSSLRAARAIVNGTIRGRRPAQTVLEYVDQRRPGAIWQYAKREDGQWFMRYINQNGDQSSWGLSRIGPLNDELTPTIRSIKTHLPRKGDPTDREEDGVEACELDEEQSSHTG